MLLQNPENSKPGSGERAFFTLSCFLVLQLSKIDNKGKFTSDVTISL